MSSKIFKVTILLSVFLLLAVPAAAARKGGDAESSAPPVAWQQIGSSGLAWEPVQEFESVFLRVTGSQGLVFEGEFPAGAPIFFDLSDQEGYSLSDGTYHFELTGTPYLSNEMRSRFQAARDAGQVVDVPKSGFVQDGAFTIVAGSVVDPDLPEPPAFKDSPGIQTRDGISAKDVVVNDDKIIIGSLCVGFDCVNGEAFGFDTIRLKENNLRIHFQDTSTSASFPTRDYRWVANDSSNGGASYMALEDTDLGRQTFRVFSGAPANALTVDASGDVGLGTANAVTELHIIDGDTPTLRLEQDGSSGFTPQTWDLAGNETNFFVRDVTNGSRLPFRVRPNAPTSSIDVAGDGDVGIGTASPTARLNVVGGNVHVLGANNTIAQLEVISQGTTQNAQLFLRSTGDDWFFAAAPGGTFTMSRVGTGVSEVSVSPAGSMTIQGDYFSTTCSAMPCAPDYVFEPDYDLMPIGELGDYVRREKHLPNIPSASELVGPINLSKMQMKLLEKIEELTLYTLAQQETIDELRARLETLEKDQN